MGMNPRMEDFERLAVRWAEVPHALDGYANIVAAISAFPELYKADRDSLPQLDSDRAFWLAAKASNIVDHIAVAAENDTQAQALYDEATGYLEEALKLDPSCFDARRIRRTIENPGRDEIVAFLKESLDEVRESCQKTMEESGLMAPKDRLSMSVYMRPYLRWLFDLANEQLNCGRYRLSLEACQKLLDLDAADMVGARMVAAYDYVKLEDAEGLQKLTERFDEPQNAWFLLARCFMAYKQRRLSDAADILAQIVRSFPSSGCTLTYQDELPPGTFGHLEFAPATDDELFVAVSEAAVILDENCGDYMSPLSDWIACNPAVVEAKEQEDAKYEFDHPAEPVRPRERTRGGARGQQGGRNTNGGDDEPSGCGE